MRTKDLLLTKGIPFFLLLFFLLTTTTQAENLMVCGDTYSLGPVAGATALQATANGTFASTTTCSCPPGAVVVGYEGTSGAWIDSYRLACKTLNPDGTLSAATTYTCYNGSSFGPTQQGPFITPGNNALIGGYIRGGDWFDYVQGHYQSIAYIGDQMSNSTGSSTLPGFVNAFGGSDLGTVFVPDGNVIVGMITRNTNFPSGVEWQYAPIIKTDNTPPTAICQNVTAMLDVSGAATITAAQVDNGSSDACGIASMSLSNTTFDCDDVIPNLPLPFVINHAGRDFTISTFNINSTGNNNTYVTPGSTVSVTLNWNSVYASTYCPGCVQQFYVGLGMETSNCLYSGNTSSPRSGSQTFTFTAPTTPGTYFFQSSSSLQFSCINPANYANTINNAIGSIVVTNNIPITVLTVTDNTGNIATCSATINVVDNITPTATCQDVTVMLDSMGVATITPADIDNGSSDNCAITSMTLNNTDFDCDDLIPNFSLPFVRSFAGRDFTISSFDINSTGNNNSYVTPGSTVSVNLNWNSVYASTYCSGCIQQFYVGLGTETTNCLYSGNTSSPRSGTESFTFTAPTTPGTYYFHASSSLQFSCILPSGYSTSSVGAIGSIVVGPIPQTVLTVMDASGNTSTCSAVVTVEDDIAPIPMCQDITVTMDSDGMATITAADIDNGSSDNCAITNMTIDQSTFGCADVLPAFPLPFVEIYAGRELSINTFDINGTGNNNTFVAPGSTVSVYVDWKSEYVSTYCPGCIQQYYVGLGTETTNCLYSGNTSAPRVGSQSFNFTAPTTPGTYYFHASSSLQFSCILPGGYSTSSVGAIGSIVVGAAPITVLTVSDASGNSSSCSAIVTVEDNIAPVAMCQDVTVILDSSGVATITAGDVDNGSSDNCSITSMTLSQSTFGCGDALPTFPMPFEASYAGRDFTISSFDIDGTGNNNTYVAPGATVSVSLDWNSAYASTYCPGCIQQFYVGLGTETTNCLYSGSTSSPRSGTESFTFTAPTTPGVYYFHASSSLQFSCILPASYSTSSAGAIGAIVVGSTPTTILTVTDASGNSSTCSANVTVVDNIAPVAMCQEVTVMLDSSGVATITGMDIDDGSTDNCSIDNMTVSPSSFDCSAIGVNAVVFTVTDIFGNTSTCTANVTVEEDIAPIALCQDLTVMLDSSGVATITGMDIDNGSSDNCAIDSMSVSPSSFDCNSIGSNPVVFTVRDIFGNTSTCTANVTVLDNIAPIAMCQDLTFTLDNSGTVVISETDIDNGSSDNCGITSMTLDETTFDCNDLGINPVVLTLSDASGNTSTCTSMVTILAGNACNNLAVVVRLKAWLEGPYSSTTGLMSDNLRSSNLIPLTEPYTGLGYTPALQGGGETIDPSVLATTGPDAIVDWILVELRNSTDFTIVMASKAVLIQADGDVVDLDGYSPVTIEGLGPDTYYIALMHRNHLGVMTPGAMPLSLTSAVYDFKTGQAYGNLGGGVQKSIGPGVFGLYEGDLDFSGIINASDRSTAWNTRNTSGYMLEDSNFDGTCNASERSQTWNNRNKDSKIP